MPPRTQNGGGGLTGWPRTTRPASCASTPKPGIEHARRQHGRWLSDRGRTDEAIDVIRPLANEHGDEVAERFLAGWLADGGHVNELRLRADAGSYPALYFLAEWLSCHEHLAELRALLVAHREVLAGWLARGAYPMRVVRLVAELGDDDARLRLQGWLSRLRERADSRRRARPGVPGRESGLAAFPARLGLNSGAAGNGSS